MSCWMGSGRGRGSSLATWNCKELHVATHVARSYSIVCNLRVTCVAHGLH